MRSDAACLDTFYAKHPEFILAPAAVALMLAAWPHGMSTWGVGALHYVAFSILLQFALHGWMCCYESVLREGKIQQEAAFDHGPVGIATRQTAVLLSNMMYALVPLRPASASWWHFIRTLVAFAVLYDAYFFLWHRAFHKSMRLYRCFHKLHHSIRDPMCFTAYYVTYQSHFVTEQIVFVSASYLFVPRDVLLFYLYYALFETFGQHAGIEIDQLRLPFAPVLRVGHVRRLLSFYALPLGSYTTAHHDWHHERNCKNYALAFTYLDRLAGTHFAGRQAPAVAALAAAHASKGLADPDEHRGPLVASESGGVEPTLAKRMPPRIASARQLSGG